MVRFTERFFPAPSAAGQHGAPRFSLPASFAGKACLFLALCLILTLFPAGMSASLADTPGSGYVNYNSVFFRKTPSTKNNSEYWGLLDYAWPVTVLDSETNADGAWYRIETTLPRDPSLSVSGYIMQRYVTVTVPFVTSAPTAAPAASPAVSQAAYINTDRVYFRKNAGTSSDNWALLPIDWPVTVTGFTFVGSAKWYSVSAAIPNGPDTPVAGYVRSDYVTLGTPAVPPSSPSGADEETAPFSGYALVLYSGTNVRLTADPASVPVTALVSGQVVTVLEGEKDGSVHIQMQFMDGFVPSSSLKMLTTDEYAALMDPSYTPFPELQPDPAALPAGEPFEDPAETAASDAETPAPTGDLSGYALVVNDGAPLRLAADPNAVSFTALLSGQIVTLLDDGENGMFHVRVQVLEGFVSGSDIRFLTEEEYASLIDPSHTPAPSATPTPTPAPTFTPAPTPAYMILGYIQLIKGGVNLRSEPGGASLNPSEETQLLRYTYLPYIQQPVFHDGWYWIQVYSPQLDAYGYIRSDCYQIVSATPAPSPSAGSNAENGPEITGYLRLTRPDVNLRSAPGGKSLTPDEKDRLTVDTPIAFYGVPVSRDGYTWAFICYNGVYGYIRSDCYEILLSTETPEPTSTPVPQLLGYIHTTAEDVNIRKTPGGPILIQVKTGTILPWYGDTVHEGETWKMVWLEQKKAYAYVMGSLTEEYTYITPAPTLSPFTDAPTVSPVPTPAYITVVPAATSTPAAALGYALTTASQVNIRTSASADSRSLSLVADAGTVIMTTGEAVMERNTLWFPVLYNGTAGFINGDFVRVLSDWESKVYQAEGVVPTPSPIPVDPSQDSDHLVITSDRVFIRLGSGYSFPSEPVFANNGDTFLYYGSAADASGSVWYRIDFKGAERYINSSFARILSISEYEELTAANATPVPTQIPAPAPEPSGAPSSDPSGNDLSPDLSGEIIIVIPSNYRLLSKDSEGSDVRELQEALYLLGYLDLEGITGIFDSSTQTAVITFQSEHGLDVTGIVNQDTWDGIFLYFIDAEG